MLNLKKIHIGILLSCILMFGSNLCYPLQGSPPIFHKVNQGETLYRISLLYDISVAELKRMNALPSNSINEGEKLIVGYKVLVENDTKDERKNSYHRLANQLDDLRQKALNNYEQLEERYDPISILDSLFENTPFTDPTFEAENQILESQKEQLRSDFGLSTSARFDRNFEPGVFNAEETFFDSRVSAGLNWELLGNGLLGNKIQADALNQQMKINDILASKSQKQENYSYQYNYLIYQFNIHKKEVLEYRIQLIEEFLKLAAKLYYVRVVSWEKVVELKAELATIKESQRRLDNYNRAFEASYDQARMPTLAINNLPILDIDISRLIKTSTQDSLNTELIALERQRLALNNSTTKDLSLKARVNLNAVSGAQLDGNRIYGSVGFTFSAPLFANRKDRKVQEAKIALTAQNYQRSTETAQNELVNLYYEYEYTIKQYTTIEGKKQVLLERIRKEKDQQLVNENDRQAISILKQLNELEAINFELVEVKQRLYLQLLKMYSRSDAKRISDFAQPRARSLKIKKHADQRGVYLWSNSLNKYDHTFLIRYMVNNDIKRLMLSDTKANQPSNFQAELSGLDLEVYKLIGENSFAIKGITPKFAQSISDLDSRYQGVHLDIEPQALEDWNEKRAQYLDTLVSVYRGIRKLLPSHQKLSVSIPYSLSTPTLKKIFDVVDEVVIMAYGKPDAYFVSRKIQEELGLSTSTKQITIALRAKDFEDRIQLEEVIQELTKNTGIERFIIQDLGSLVTLDQKTILGNINGEEQ